VWLTSVAPEVALGDEQADQQSDLELV